MTRRRKKRQRGYGRGGGVGGEKKKEVNERNRSGDFPGGPEVKSLLCNPGAGVQSLLGK